MVPPPSLAERHHPRRRSVAAWQPDAAQPQPVQERHQREGLAGLDASPGGAAGGNLPPWEGAVPAGSQPERLQPRVSFGPAVESCDEPEGPHVQISAGGPGEERRVPVCASCLGGVLRPSGDEVVVVVVGGGGGGGCADDLKRSNTTS